MNYTYLIEKAIKQFQEEHPEYTFGELLFTVLSSCTAIEISRAGIKGMKDEDFYDAIYTAIRKEEKEE